MKAEATSLPCSMSSQLCVRRRLKEQLLKYLCVHKSSFIFSAFPRSIRTLLEKNHPPLLSQNLNLGQKCGAKWWGERFCLAGGLSLLLFCCVRTEQTQKLSAHPGRHTVATRLAQDRHRTGTGWLSASCWSGKWAELPRAQHQGLGAALSPREQVWAGACWLLPTAATPAGMQLVEGLVPGSGANISQFHLGARPRLGRQVGLDPGALAHAWSVFSMLKPLRLVGWCPFMCVPIISVAPSGSHFTCSGDLAPGITKLGGS